jgi:hypothetical protein
LWSLGLLKTVEDIRDVVVASDGDGLPSPLRDPPKSLLVLVPEAKWVAPMAMPSWNSSYSERSPPTWKWSLIQIATNALTAVNVRPNAYSMILDL